MYGVSLTWRPEGFRMRAPLVLLGVGADLSGKTRIR